MAGGRAPAWAGLRVPAAGRERASARREVAMNLLSIAHVPPVIVSPDDSVMTAIEVSLPQRVGAVSVMERGRLVGIFTERDVMLKIVHQKRDPERTLIRDVMTSPVMTVKPDTNVGDVLHLMLDRHIRHLPVSQDGTTVLGMLSIRNVLQYMVEDLQSNVHHLQSYIASEAVIR
jgi:CBS domain-containing protein